jgi:hypothetical protein
MMITPSIYIVLSLLVIFLSSFSSFPVFFVFAVRIQDTYPLCIRHVVSQSGDQDRGCTPLFHIRIRVAVSLRSKIRINVAKLIKYICKYIMLNDAEIMENRSLVLLGHGTYV